MANATVSWKPNPHWIAIDVSAAPLSATVTQISVIPPNPVDLKVVTCKPDGWVPPPVPTPNQTWQSDGVITNPIPWQLVVPPASGGSNRYVVQPTYNGGAATYAQPSSQSTNDLGNGKWEYVFGFTAPDGTLTNIVIQIQQAGGGGGKPPKH